MRGTVLDQADGRSIIGLPIHSCVMKLTFLGTRGEIEMRTRRHWRHSALLVTHARRRVLVDCGLDWLRLVERIRPRAIVLTHAHPDHAFGLKRGAPCPVYATADCWSSIARFPIADRHTIRPGQRINVEGIRFQAFTVEHSLRAPAVGYRISVGQMHLFYAPDLVFIHKRTSALRNVRVYIGDGATLTRPLVRRRDGRPIGHTTVRTQLTWCSKAGVPRAVITHCGSEIVRAPHARMAARIQELASERGVAAVLAYDGMTLQLASRR
jgi:ribonuclease BN (tRNA processing enzyme)